MKLPYYLTTLLVVFLISSATLRSQEYVFEYLPVTELTGEQAEIVGEYISHPLYQHPTIARAFDPTEVAEAENGIVRIQLPDTKEVVSFKFSGGYEDNTNSVWYAETFGPEGERNLSGNLFIVKLKESQGVMGTLQYENSMYEFMPASNGYCVIYRVDKTQLSASDNCGVELLEENRMPIKPKPTAGIEKDNFFPCGLGKVTILLMTSPAARSAVPANNINNVINTAVAQLKFSLNNSYVSPDNIDIMTVSPVLSTSFVEGVDIKIDVDNLDVDFEQTRVNNAFTSLNSSYNEEA